MTRMQSWRIVAPAPRMELDQYKRNTGSWSEVVALLSSRPQIFLDRSQRGKKQPINIRQYGTLLEVYTSGAYN